MRRLPIATLVLAAGPAFAQIVTKYDGAYRGMMTAIENNAIGRNPACFGSPFREVIAIQNGAFRFNYNPTYHLVIDATVNGDGTVHGTGKSDWGGMILDGKIDVGVLTGTIRGGQCLYAISLTKTKT